LWPGLPAVACCVLTGLLPANLQTVNVVKVIRKRLRGRGLDVDLNAVVSINTSGSSRTSASSRQTAWSDSRAAKRGEVDDAKAE